MLVGERLRRVDDLMQIGVHELVDDVDVVELGVGFRLHQIENLDDLHAEGSAAIRRGQDSTVSK